MNELRRLLASADTGDTIDFHLVRKRGEPMLLLPLDGARSARALELYPAQTFRARAWKRLLALALRVRWPLTTVSLALSESTPFGRFLAQIEGADLRAFAVLFGNPRAAGRRFVFLLFGNDDQPCAVVKAGATEQASALVLAEADLLASLPTGTPGAPGLRARFADSTQAALALDFVPGSTPSVDDPAIEPLLTAWVDRSRRTALAEIPAFGRITRGASGLVIHPALMHGDFAPWNVRVHDGRWTALDWERGELTGVPGWDWLHFVVQHAVLVEHLDAAQVQRRIADLIRSAPFSRYAQGAGFAGSEETIAAGYVHYCAEVLRPTERASVFAELAALMPPPA
ncbi:MAG: hypothetical protein ABMA13_14590 [Chthoniobacteraceae bacterium]